jgi:SAM-dependent methyltransferase
LPTALPVHTCRSCGGSELHPILSLGETPIANELVQPDAAPEVDAAFPLGIMLCTECGLVQLDHELPADVIFDQDYPYYSSFSPAMLEHAATHARGLARQRDLDGDSFVVELASNDGYLLRNFVELGIPVLGIDPAPGPASAAIEAGVPTLVDFFGVEVARRVRADQGAADVVIANNVMAHVPDLNDFVGGIAALLADTGIATIENPWVRDLVDHVEFDTIYHEHYCYFSTLAVERLMARHGLHLRDVEHFPDHHGGTLRWTVGHQPGRSERAEAVLAEERRLGVDAPAYYDAFADKVTRVLDGLGEMLEAHRDRGEVVAAYGAAAKGATLLNAAGVGRDLIAYVVDRNVHKQGMLMPGCRLPVRDPAALVQEQPDAVLLLAWNFATEIVKQQADYLAGGGRFLVPVGADGLPGELR